MIIDYRNIVNVIIGTYPYVIIIIDRILLFIKNIFEVYYMYVGRFFKSHK